MTQLIKLVKHYCSLYKILGFDFFMSDTRQESYAMKVKYGNVSNGILFVKSVITDYCQLFNRTYIIDYTINFQLPNRTYII